MPPRCAGRWARTPLRLAARFAICGIRPSTAIQVKFRTRNIGAQRRMAAVFTATAGCQTMPMRYSSMEGHTTDIQSHRLVSQKLLPSTGALRASTRHLSPTSPIMPMRWNRLVSISPISLCQTSTLRALQSRYLPNGSAWRTAPRWRKRSAPWSCAWSLASVTSNPCSTRTRRCCVQPMRQSILCR
jgi:hypothetical protein